MAVRSRAGHLSQKGQAEAFVMGMATPDIPNLCFDIVGGTQMAAVVKMRSVVKELLKKNQVFDNG